jgi:two-component system response regulator YesN
MSKCTEGQVYSVMVIEDERIERQALVLMLRNNFPELSTIVEASNGFEAISVAKNHKIDIALVDVGLPGISGLDLIQEMQQIGAETSFIIVSSHDDFEFAQKAIKLGVEDYLLKPVRPDVLKQTVSNSITKKESRNKVNITATVLQNRMENIRPLVESDFIYTIISNGPGESLRQMLSFLSIDCKSGLCLVVSELGAFNSVDTLIKNALEKVGNKLVSGFFNNNLVLCILFGDKSESTNIDNSIAAICDYILSVLENAGYDFHIGVSSPVREIAAWNEAYRQSSFALKRAIEENISLKKYSEDLLPLKEIYNTNGNTAPLAVQTSILARAILDNREEQQKEIMENILLSIVSGHDFIRAREEAYKFIILLREELLRSLPVPGLQFDTDTALLSAPGVLSAQEPRYLKTSLLAQVEKFSHVVNEFRDQIKNTFVERAIQYIRDNYQKEISLSSIAREIHVSPYYLSKMFRKYTGKTCTEIISLERVEAAKKLLLRNYNSKETCYQVGFNSQNYFAKIFKKLCGMTPGEYRGGKLAQQGVTDK